MACVYKSKAHLDGEIDNVIITKDYWREGAKRGSLYQHSFHNLRVVTLHICTYIIAKMQHEIISETNRAKTGNYLNMWHI